MGVYWRSLNGPGRHPSCQVWFLQYLLDWVIDFDNDVVVLEVWVQAAGCVYQG